MKWSWVGITTYLNYSFGGYIYERVKFGLGDDLLIIIIPTMTLLFIVLIFFYLPNVTKYFGVSLFQKLLTVFLPIAIYLTVTRNPNPNSEIINIYYIDVVNDRMYLNDEVFNGKIFSNYKNGALEFEGQVNNGKEIGKWVHYHQNGNIEHEKTYEDGIPTGKSVTYFSDGTLKEEKNYLYGKLNGEYKVWLDKDELDFTGNFKNDLKHGEWRKYEDEIIRIYIYNLDTLVKTKYKEYDKF